MAVKTYVLLESMDADAPVYQQVADGQRIQIKKIPLWRPFLRTAFQDEKGISRVIRYKSTAVDAEGKTVLDQREQIDKLKIDANERFTTSEYRDLEFKQGVLVTNKTIAQDYLDIYPANEKFKGISEDHKQPAYKELNPQAEAKIKNNDMRLRVKAANKVLELDLKGKQELLIRINGSFFDTPTDDYDCENLLMEWVDDTNEQGLILLLKDEKETTIDEKTTVLIGKLLNAEILEFNISEGTISKNIDGRKIELKTIVADSLEEMKRLFSDYLNTNSGKALKNDLENDLQQVEPNPVISAGKTEVIKEAVVNQPTEQNDSMLPIGNVDLGTTKTVNKRPYNKKNKKKTVKHKVKQQMPEMETELQS